MPDTNTLSTLDPFSSTKPREAAPLGGRMGFYEDNFEQVNEGPVKPHEILGSIRFNKVAEKVGESVVDATKETFGLMEYVAGIGGEEFYISPQGSVVEQAGAVAQKSWENTGAGLEPSDQEKARAIVDQLKRSEELDRSLSIEERKKAMSESLRFTGRILDYDETKKEGFLDKDAAATLAWIARKDQEDAARAEDQAKKASIPSPAKRASALNAAVEGAAGKLNPELSTGPSANISATGGGPG